MCPATPIGIVKTGRVVRQSPFTVLSLLASSCQHVDTHESTNGRLLPLLTHYTATCSNYLCPDTLACVHFPHHCPCPHPDVEDKIELAEGIAVCASKGGYKAGEAIRKVDLARKGLL